MEIKPMTSNLRLRARRNGILNERFPRLVDRFVPVCLANLLMDRLEVFEALLFVTEKPPPGAIIAYGHLP